MKHVIVTDATAHQLAKLELRSACLPKADDKMKLARNTWAGGKEASEMAHIEIEGGGHSSPAQRPSVSRLGESTMDILASDLMWDFFRSIQGYASTQHRQEPSNETLNANNSRVLSRVRGRVL